MMRFLLSMIVAWACCISPLCAESAAPGTLYERLLTAKQVRVGVSADAPPFGVRRGGVYTGFDIDIAEAVLRGMGFDDIVYVPVSSSERIPAITDGKVDVVIANMTQTRGREAQVDFTIPYFQDGVSLLVAADSPVKTYQDLAGVSIGVEAGTTAITALQQVAPACNQVVKANEAELRAALQSGEISGISTDLLLLLSIRRACTEPAKWRIAGTRFTTEPYAMAVPRDQSAWRNALNHQLLAMWEDGTWARIAKTWFGPGTPNEHRMTFAMTPYPK